jgi:hypothetical protein
MMLSMVVAEVILLLAVREMILSMAVLEVIPFATEAGMGKTESTDLQQEQGETSFPWVVLLQLMCE